MPASGISSELSAHQMAPAEAISQSRARLCPRASSLSLFSLVSPLRPLGLGLLGRCDPRPFMYFYVVLFLRRYGRRSGQPSSSSLARRACVHVLPFSSAVCRGTQLHAGCGMGTCFLRVHGQAHLELRKRPWPLRRPRGDGNGGRFVRSPCLPVTPYTRHCPLVPVQRQSIELPATTVGECRRRHSLRRHKGGRWTVRLTSRHHVLQGGFSSVWCVLRRSGQSPSADARGLRWLRWPRVRARWRFKQDVESGLSVVVEWRQHSTQAGTPRGRWSKGTDPRTGGRRPKDRSSGGIPSYVFVF